MQVLEVAGAVVVLFAAAALLVVVLNPADPWDRVADPGRRAESDPYESMLPELRVRAAASPGLAALLDEVDRGRARRDAG